MEQVIAQSIRVNNEGAMHLMRGDLPAASRSFTAALQLSREVAVVLEPNEVEGSNTTTSMMVTSTSMERDDHSVASEPCNQVLSVDACMDQGTSPRVGTSSNGRSSHHAILLREDEVTQDRSLNHYYTYHRPITIPHEIELLVHGQCPEGQEIPSTQEWGHFLACIATFNISLSLQLKAQQRQERTSLPVVVRLYRLCLRLLEKDQDFKSGVLHYALAVWNNLGVVHHALNQEQSAKLCFDHVWSTLCQEMSGNATPPSTVDNDLAWEEYAKNVSNYLTATAERILPPAA